MNIKFSTPAGVEIELVRSWFTGSFKCLADGEEYQIKDPLDLGTHFAINTTHNYTVEIGDAAKHLIEIEHTRPRFMGGLRPQRYVVKLDGNLVADRTGF